MRNAALKEWKFLSHQQLGYRCDWSNCGGSHLLIKMPTGEWFDTGLRASNCIAEHRTPMSRSRIIMKLFYYECFLFRKYIENQKLARKKVQE